MSIINDFNVLIHIDRWRFKNGCLCTKNNIEFRHLKIRIKTSGVGSVLKRSHSDAFSDNDQALIDGLFTYIKNNKILPERLAAIRDDDPCLNQLLDAIHAGDHAAAIFSNPDCHLYLLSLITTKKVPFWQGINVYFYLMTLMQFTHKQSLKEDDIGVRVYDCPIEVTDLIEKGQQYLESVCAKFKKLGVTICFSELEQFVRDLPATERWLYRLQYRRMRHPADYHALMSILMNGTVPYLVDCTPSSQEGNMRYCWAPSATLINYFLLKVSSEPVMRQPIFGSVKVKTLQAMHLDGRHPYPLYSPLVKSNLSAVHGARCGPVGAAMHDDAHDLWGSMLTPVERNQLYKVYIPKFENYERQVRLEGKIVLADVVKTAIDRLYDFDLLAQRFINPTTRFYEYIYFNGIAKLETRRSWFKGDELTSLDSFIQEVSQCLSSSRSAISIPGSGHGVFSSPSAVVSSQQNTTTVKELRNGPEITAPTSR